MGQPLVFSKRPFDERITGSYRVGMRTIRCSLENLLQQREEKNDALDEHPAKLATKR
jgi:hypothetical protein